MQQCKSSVNLLYFFTIFQTWGKLETTTSEAPAEFISDLNKFANVLSTAKNNMNEK